MRGARQGWRIAAQLALLGCALAAAACDGGFRVRGELVTSGTSCRMKLHDAKDGKVLRDRSVSGSFDTVFTIDVLSHDNYLTIGCDGVTETFKSETLRLGGRRNFDQPLNLGKIVLPPPKRD